ncbi:4-hydroxy-3-methylbut-2-enyl diphosphate reductase [Posidoniimonas polymericola]|uniref:4-hydroxy-3-methylbut-2-enyl diphosphate reductase n=1 Tax=Posidoniimonas polymericola TaxID=2528002 RepID=A0A5C5YRI5_9BACT|nr:4-hydroxy-3-methylbut-2-enyl diphosphate reductase [Posidoniimonas polymericola]TWT77458.1 4-hydroxy-3-methylbut-2-enyl diphosphate reductase [Posidoniimonas polymericola]
MKVLLASPRGFCAGVNMAIESLELALASFGAPIYVYHEIVHNRYVVSHFKDRGVTFLDDIEDAPEGSTLLFSAHGVSPLIREAARRRNLTAIDATCPLVTKVHLEAIKYAKAGYTILLIGHEGHDEVIGTMGEAPEATLLVESPEDVDRLKVADEKKVAYLTQTTLSVDDANRIIDRLKQRFPHIAAPPKSDICYATSNRQEAVAKLATQADLTLVLGSQNSSNSARLAELSTECGTPAHLIDGAGDIDPAWLEGVETVLVTAGASAPETVVNECLDLLRDRYNATVEPQVIRTESVSFPLPRELRGHAAETEVTSVLTRS